MSKKNSKEDRKSQTHIKKRRYSREKLWRERERDGGTTGPFTNENRSERRRGRADVRDDGRGVRGRVWGAIDRIHSETTTRFPSAEYESERERIRGAGRAFVGRNEERRRRR